MGPEREKAENQTRRFMDLERKLIALVNTVESLFVDAVVGMLEEGTESVDELREEDYKAHERWLELDSACPRLLSDGEPSREQILFVMAAVKIAADLKRVADESLRIGETLRSAPLASIIQDDPSDCLAEMVELAQSMLSDVIEAFINRDVSEASGLHLVFRELSSLHARVVREVPEAAEKGEVTAPAGTALICVAQRLERIGDEVVDISNHVTHLYRNTGQ